MEEAEFSLGSIELAQERAQAAAHRAVQCRARLGPEARQVYRAIMEGSLRQGRAPTVPELSARLSISPHQAEEAMAKLHAADVVIGSGEAGVTRAAYPFSSEPTPFRVHLDDGPQVWACCAVVALGIPFLARKGARIATRCASSGVEIAIDVRRGRARSRPPDAVVWYSPAQPGQSAIIEQ